MDNHLHVVFCVDTEGPLYESPAALFTRVEQHFGISLKPTPENLANLQEGLGVPEDIREKVRQFTAPRLTTCYGDWQSIEKMLDSITGRAFRHNWEDSEGNGLKYSWFLLDHVGYETNPRRRILGHHAVFDFYREYLTKDCDAGDALQFHYHPLPYNKKAHSCATYYFNGNHLMTTLARKIIDRAWFPSAYRPAFHTIRPDSHWFLEQWIPFDYSSQAGRDDANGECSPDRFGDWRRAPHFWGGYHPSHDDYQVPGNCNRWIFRCLNANARLRVVTPADVVYACRQARENGVAVLAVADHDFRNMELSIRPFYDLVRKAAAEHDVRLIFSNAHNAARAFARLEAQGPGLGLELRELPGEETHMLRVTSAQGIFGPQPFLALKTRDGSYYYDNFDFDAASPKHCWSYVFDWQTFGLDGIECIGVAASSPSGVVDVLRFWPASQRQERQSLHG